jgi:hypothetical protein
MALKVLQSLVPMTTNSNSSFFHILAFETCYTLSKYSHINTTTCSSLHTQLLSVSKLPSLLKPQGTAGQMLLSNTLYISVL